MTEFRQTTPPPPDGGETPPPPPKWDEVDWDTWTPPSGGEGAPRLGSGMPDLRPLFALIDVMRSALPTELRDQFNNLVRELLLTMRALIDWYLERLPGGKPETKVEDIPIE